MLHVHPGRPRGGWRRSTPKRASTSRSPQVIFRYRHKNGSWRWVELTGCPYREFFRRDPGDSHQSRRHRSGGRRTRASGPARSRAPHRRNIALLLHASAADDFEAGVQRGLRAASELAGADRAQFFAIDSGVAAPSARYFHWSAEGIEPGASRATRDEMRREVPLVGDKAPPGRGHRRCARPGAYRTRPPAERDSLMEEGVQSYLAIPHSPGRDDAGMSRFLLPSQRERRWSQQEIARLHLLADVFASALRRHRAEISRRETEYRFQDPGRAHERFDLRAGRRWKDPLREPELRSEISGYTPDELNAMEPRDTDSPGRSRNHSAEEHRRGSPPR